MNLRYLILLSLFPLALFPSGHAPRAQEPDRPPFDLVKCRSAAMTVTLPKELNTQKANQTEGEARQYDPISRDQLRGKLLDHCNWLLQVHRAELVMEDISGLSQLRNETGKNKHIDLKLRARFTRFDKARGKWIGVALRGADLDNTDLRGVSLSWADLRGVSLRGAALSGAQLRGVALRGAVLIGADLRKADLRGADLRGAVLFRADLRKAELDDADLSGARLTRANLQETKFHRANLHKAILVNADLRRAFFIGSNLRETVMDRADLREAELDETDLHGAKLISANLQGAWLTRADLRAAQLVSADLQGARLRRTDLRRANLHLADLSYAKLILTDLRETDLSDADLHGARLDRTNLNNANFRASNLSGMIFEPQAETAAIVGAMAGARNLEQMSYHTLPEGLVSLRARFKREGFREQERKITHAIERRKTGLAAEQGGRFCLTAPFRCAEALLKFLLVDLTSGYGLHPGRTLWLLLLVLIPGFSLIYLVFIMKAKKPAIWLLPPENSRFEEDAKIALRPILYNRYAPAYAFYFSVLSAFRIGWGGPNARSWINRIMPVEYHLLGRGWVKVVSGFQTIISMYLIALWVLTAFGRPFG